MQSSNLTLKIVDLLFQFVFTRLQSVDFSVALTQLRLHRIELLKLAFQLDNFAFAFAQLFGVLTRRGTCLLFGFAQYFSVQFARLFQLFLHALVVACYRRKFLLNSRSLVDFCAQRLHFVCLLLQHFRVFEARILDRLFEARELGITRGHLPRQFLHTCIQL